MHTIEKLEDLRKWCTKQFMARMGATDYKDFAVALQGMNYILDKIEKKKAWQVLELGAGFSTLALRTFTPFTRTYHDSDETFVVQFVTADHDKAWLDFVTGLLNQKKLRYDQMYTTDQVREIDFEDPFDVIIVDHGPTMGTRVDDLPWIVSNLSPKGIILLDDFRQTTNYQRVCVEALEKLGCECRIEEASRSSSNRAIGIARRKA